MFHDIGKRKTESDTLLCSPLLGFSCRHSLNVLFCIRGLGAAINVQKILSCIGHVQAVPLAPDAWEIGYHIGERYTKCGYCTEALRAFLPVILPMLGLDRMSGVCLADNAASRKVMERCGFVLEYEGIGPYQGSDCRICRYRFEAKGDETI